jgi:hypothetical protein
MGGIQIKEPPGMFGGIQEDCLVLHTTAAGLEELLRRGFGWGGWLSNDSQRSLDACAHAAPASGTGPAAAWDWVEHSAGFAPLDRRVFAGIRFCVDCRLFAW